jgi:hypothetical protein
MVVMHEAVFFVIPTPHLVRMAGQKREEGPSRLCPGAAEFRPGLPKLDLGLGKRVPFRS